MSFADTFNIRADTVSFNDVANAFDALISRSVFSSNVSIINTTSTAFTDYGSVAATFTVAAGEKIALLTSATFSNSNAGQLVYLELYRDAVALDTPQVYTAETGQTDGRRGTLVHAYIDSPAPGTYTYKPRWKVSANTGYSLSGFMLAFNLRVS